MNGTQGSALKSFYGYADTFNKDHIWVEIPKEGINCHLSMFLRALLLIAGQSAIYPGHRSVLGI